MIFISYPKSGVGRVQLSLHYVHGLALRYYLKEAHLWGRRLSCRVMRKNPYGRVTSAYVPKDGETIVLELVRA